MSCLRSCLAVVLLSLASTASAVARTDEAMVSPDVSASDILLRLDLTSFRNSTGPARPEGLKHPGDWSFTELETAGGVATLVRPGDWSVSLNIIRWTPEGVIACFGDRARNGGSYAAQSALRIVSDGLAGYRVEDEVSESSCPPLPGQG